MNEEILEIYDTLIIFGFYAFLAAGVVVFLYEIYRGSGLKPMAQREKEHSEFQESLGEDFDNE